jgi:DNA-binding IclR family transcriptional regulator
MAEQPTRRVSSVVFGNSHRLELLLALTAAGEEGICVKDLADSCAVATSVFHAPLQALIAAGLVARRSARGHNRRVFYAFTDVGAWTRLPELVHDLGSRIAAPGADGGTES